MIIDWRAASAVMFVAAAVAAAAGNGAAAEAPRPLLDAMFQDHAVLQRDRPIVVWGKATPGDQVTVAFDRGSARASVDVAGRWRATLPPMSAGGPYSLSVRTRSGAGQVVSDVLVGDVWLCSGQSNMELPVSGTLDAAREIAGSANPLIRVLTVSHATSPTPLEEFPLPVAWQAAEPNVIRDFSAACYYFARELQKSVPVPMGLIHSSFGGSSIESWFSEAGLRALGGFDERLDLLRLYARDANAGNQRFAADVGALVARPCARRRGTVAGGGRPGELAHRAATDARLENMGRSGTCQS